MAVVLCGDDAIIILYLHKCVGLRNFAATFEAALLTASDGQVFRRLRPSETEEAVKDDYSGS